MSKSRPRRASRKPFYLILALSLTIAIGYSVWNTYFRPQPLNIMAITQTPLAYGNTTISGILQKDSPAGSPGTFFLALSDMQVITLDVQGLDPLLGQPVSISGYLVPVLDFTNQMYMTVDQVTTK